MEASKEASLAWIASGGFTPEQAAEILITTPEPREILERFRRGEEIPGAETMAAKIRDTLRRNAAADRIAQWESLIRQHGIRAMTIGEEEYPARMRMMPEAPAILFYQGDPEAGKREKAVSIVGSRSASIHGLEATRKIAQKLSENGIIILSGLAYGIDASAHTGCLKGGSPTAAILGCGLDQEYPSGNAKLRKEIIDKGGIVISEYPPGEKPLGWHFPYRNRIISGMGDCLALMEARNRSGSMTSVRHALNQGKDVFVYPGEPGSPKSEGNHQLLREGAIYFVTAEDIMEDMGWLDKARTDGHNSGSPAGDPWAKMPPEEAQIMRALEKGALSFDQLCGETNLPAPQLNATLSMLQIQGLIAARPGKIYEIIQ